MLRIARTIVWVLALLLMATLPAIAAPPERERYIVVLHDSVDSPGAAAREIAAQVGGQVGFIYEHALKGFAIEVPAQAVAALQRNPGSSTLKPMPSGMPLPRLFPPALRAFSPIRTQPSRSTALMTTGLTLMWPSSTPASTSNTPT